MSQTIENTITTLQDLLKLYEEREDYELAADTLKIINKLKERLENEGEGKV